jgi:acyl-CoA thioester hydrolase
MPNIHTYHVSVRHYECAADGRVHPAVILHYLQEAAFSASAAVGYSAARYESLGLQWYAYETDLELMTSLRYGDSIEIKTWVADFRRVLSQRRYELYRDGIMVARAGTDWVLIDAARGRPASIPDEIVAAYSKGEALPEDGRRLSVPVLPPAPSQAFITQRRVEWRDIDPAQHVNNAVYLDYAAEAHRQALESAGVLPDLLHGIGAAILPRRYQIAYKTAARLDDIIQVTTWTALTTEAGGQRGYLLTRPADQTQIAQIRETWHLISMETEQPLAIPESLRRSLSAG